MKKIYITTIAASSIVAVSVPTALAISLNVEKAKAVTINIEEISTNKYAYKYFKGFDLFVGNEGKIKIFHNWFEKDRAHWSGESWSEVLKNEKPYKIPKIAQTNKYLLDYWGINGGSFSGGISAGTNGAEASLGFSVSVSSNDKEYSETREYLNQELIFYDYDLSARFSSWSGGATVIRSEFFIGNGFSTSVDTEVSAISKEIFKKLRGNAIWWRLEI
ncbi:hypothetical protein HUN03_00701 [Mycoplasmopsis anatis]|uniref:Uncharacterized protein n=1 Tax=Mycoplasmopsis anatis TaxID=171279 RepID=A0A9Q3L7P2_9BACT|nr:hypothetical protein [Mycoplasmopsis anatis]MBW0594316.1 hypothetical protein [Mycoplasmopsis anatis]MBW0595139.1 hypothetical protein [Mycoplasmopsis anatis]MBW0596549.1 hypothetical protein [Mycoplasmopsis anatis]MBW0597926.1 hypothetical protein [Mycoplasmopsis anatis]MBW0598695.1 hypothetical protein [Mycoplasmopsis anatis]